MRVLPTVRVAADIVDQDDIDIHEAEPLLAVFERTNDAVEDPRPIDTETGAPSKLWQWEYDFEKEDAKIVIPLILLLLGLTFTPHHAEVLWAGAVAYYLLYFFLMPVSWL